MEIRNTFKNISLTFLYLCRKINFTQMNNDPEMHNMGHKTLVFYSLVIKSFSIQLIAKGKGKVLASRCQKVFKPWYCFIFQILLLLFVVGSEIFCVQFVTTIKKKCISAPWQWWSWGGIFKNYHRNFRLHIRHRCIFAIHLTSGPLRKKTQSSKLENLWQKLQNFTTKKMSPLVMVEKNWWNSSSWWGNSHQIWNWQNWTLCISTKNWEKFWS